MKKNTIFSFTFRISDVYWIKCLKEKAIKIFGTVNFLSESRTLEKAGIDAIVAQSYELESYRRMFIGKPANFSSVDFL